MKTRLLKLGFFALMLFAFFGCWNNKTDCSDCEKKLNEKNVELTKTKGELVDVKVKIEDYQRVISSRTQTIVLNPYKPAQSLVELSAKEKVKYKNKHYITDGIQGNNFKTTTNNGEIYLKFPVHNPTGNKIEIVDVLDASSDSINAIVVLLNGIKGIESRKKDVTHFIKTTIKIDNVDGLSKSKMKSSEKLKVYVIHDDAFYSDHLLNDFKKCVDVMGSTYKPDVCTLTPPKSKIDKLKPREQEGDIIPGG